MTDEQRQEFLKKYTIKINIDNIEDINSLEKIYKFNSEKEEEDLSGGIKYDVKSIDLMRRLFDFPQNFNFLEKYDITPKIKNQEKCGCCWAHASTTALAYRYKKSYQIDIDLSPEYGLSCYLTDCDAGNSIIDAQLNLIKNGTVTEKCLPFISGNGYIPFCPDYCQDGSEFKLYKAKNAYFTGDSYNEENFYNVVAVIMDQIIKYGPVVSGFTCFEDFKTLHVDNCKDYIYRYNGKSETSEGHAVVIVGWGFQDNKYYWLIQNSWGTTFCDEGFIKIEFGQVNIEQVSFVEPYMPDNSENPSEINLYLESINRDCNFDINFSTKLENIENGFEIDYKYINSDDKIKFICGKFKDPKNDYIFKCYFEERILPKIGEYQFQKLSSLGTENIFNFDDAFFQNNLGYYGYDFINKVFEGSDKFYISEEGSKIIFAHGYDSNPHLSSYIYANKNAKNPIKNCFDFTFMSHEFISCEVNSDEIRDFDYPEKGSDLPIQFNSYCGRFNSDIIAYKLNTLSNPVFRIRSFYTNTKDYFSANTEIIAIADVEGSTLDFIFDQLFIVFGYVIRNQEKTEILYQCEIMEKNKNSGNQTKISCYPDIKEGTFDYQRLYLQPYFFPINATSPYEVIMNETLLVENRGSSSKYLYLSYIIVISLLIF